MSVIPYVDARYKLFAKAMTLLRCLRLTTTGERRRPESDRPIRNLRLRVQRYTVKAIQQVE